MFGVNKNYIFSIVCLIFQVAKGIRSTVMKFYYLHIVSISDKPVQLGIHILNLVRHVKENYVGCTLSIPYMLT